MTSDNRPDQASGRLYDVSLTIEPGMLVWPKDTQVAIEPVASMASGATCNLSSIRLGSHTATHVDAPSHFIPGAGTVDNIPPHILVGPARLFQLGEVRQIDRQLLQALDLQGVTRVLFGTGNSALLHDSQFRTSYAGISGEAARYLVEAGVGLVGVDYLSVEEYRARGHPTHTTLLEAGVVIVEGLDLAGVPAGDYELLCLPLKLKGVDGAPARVFLRELS